MASQKGRFVEILCGRCKSKQVMFGKASTKIRCHQCSKLLSKNRGGKTKIMAYVTEVL